jgi:hypothetical protein
MTYFKINNIDFSKYVNKLKVAVKHNYKSMTSAAGNTLVKYINSKRVIEVGIIPLDDASMQQFLAEVKKFEVVISYLNPETGTLEENVKCIIPNNIVEYYSVVVDNAKFRAFSIEFSEL